ncbi:MAG: FxDxF family PEP-CTERM protein [Burkholderiaceae bacterium]
MEKFFQGLRLHSATDRQSSQSGTSWRMIFACLLAAISLNVFAANQTVTVTTTPVLPTDNTFSGLKLPGDGLLSGGEDIISFTGLAPGKYDFGVTVSGQNISFNGLTSNLNGVLGTAAGTGKFSFFGVETVGYGPFTLSLFGIAGLKSIYSGTVSVTAVPEPETILMMLVGLGMIGAIVWSKRRKGNVQTTSHNFA